LAVIVLVLKASVIGLICAVAASDRAFHQVRVNEARGCASMSRR